MRLIEQNSFLVITHLFIILDTQVKDVVPMILCLQKRLDEQLHRNDQQREREFLSHTLECLTAFNGFDVVAESWMITPYEVDFGCKIGVGGLYVYPPKLGIPVYDCFLILI